VPVVSKQPETSFAIQITLLVTGSLHVLSFPRARPTTLLLLDTIRRSAHSSSSGLPQRKRTYLPNWTWGIGSIERARVCSRIHDSGRFHLEASCLQSMNSYVCSELKDSLRMSPGWPVVFCMLLSFFCNARHIPMRRCSACSGFGYVPSATELLRLKTRKTFGSGAIMNQDWTTGWVRLKHGKQRFSESAQ
jgi:hypothetical protein